MHKIDDFFFRTIAWFSLFFVVKWDCMILWFIYSFFILSFFVEVTKFRLKEPPCIQNFFFKLIRCALLKIHKKTHHHGILLYSRFIQVPINVICHVVKKFELSFLPISMWDLKRVKRRNLNFWIFYNGKYFSLINLFISFLIYD